MSINKVILVGNIGNKEVKETNNGTMVSLSVATSESWKDKKTGEKTENTEWHNIKVFGNMADKVVAPYWNKGDKVYIEGKLQTRKWQDKDGKDRYTTEVVLNGFQGVGQIVNKIDAATENPRYGTDPMPEVQVASTAEFADDIPF